MSYSDLRKGRFSEIGRAYFVTTVLKNRELCYFNDFFCARLVVKEMQRLHEDQAVDSLAWVVMPDHLHWLFSLGESDTLCGVMKKLKARSARKINTYLESEGTIWQKAYYDHAIRDDEDIRRVARYIIANPLRANLVEDVRTYPLWDGVWI